MIRALGRAMGGDAGKPRASGDDPEAVIRRDAHLM